MFDSKVTSLDKMSEHLLKLTNRQSMVRFCLVNTKLWLQILFTS